MIYINNNKLKNFNFSFESKNFCVVMDFDRTLTTSDSNGSWTVLENPDWFDKEFVVRAKELTKKYYPYELDYTLSSEEKEKYMLEWYYKNMDLIYEYNLTHETLLNCIKHSTLKLRAGVIKFLRLLKINGIPVIILSAGIGNIIEETLKMNNCYFDNIHIISNFIKFENGKMLKFNDVMIHSSNKTLDSFSKESDSVLNEKEHILLLGDLIEDINMIPEKHILKTLTVGFLDTKIDENLGFYNKNYDVVLTENASFDDILNLITSLGD